MMLNIFEYKTTSLYARGTVGWLTAMTRGPSIGVHMFNATISLPCPQTVAYFCYEWWRHQMENFFVSLALCVENSPVIGDFPKQRPMTRSFDFSFICAWINGRENYRKVGGLIRPRAHYDITVTYLLHNHLQWKWSANSPHNCLLTDRICCEFKFPLGSSQSMIGLRIVINCPRQHWRNFCRRHFQAHFLEWELLYFDQNLIGICPQGSN